ELAFAPGLEELSPVGVDEDRMIAATDQEDPILEVDGHAGDVSMLEASRQLFPTLDHAVLHRARLDHGSSSSEPRALARSDVRNQAMRATRGESSGDWSARQPYQRRAP